MARVSSSKVSQVGFNKQFKVEQHKNSEQYCCAVCAWRPPERYWTMLQVHHIVPCCRGGENSPENVVLLCPNHHALATAMFSSSRGRDYLGPRDRETLLQALRDPERHISASLQDILRKLSEEISPGT